MSRDVEDENYYVSKGGKVPVKWTAPEVGPPLRMYVCGMCLIMHKHFG